MNLKSFDKAQMFDTDFDKHVVYFSSVLIVHSVISYILAQFIFIILVYF